MNVFEAEIAKYERRIKRIEQNPDPSYSASNKIFYQALLEHNKEQLKWWREGKPFIGTAIGSGMVVQAFGDFRPLGLIQLADRLGTEYAEVCADKVRAIGLPDYACDRTVLLLPLAIAGDELPKPKIVISRTGACEVINNAHRTLARLLGAPAYSVEVPFEDPHEPHLKYVTKQFVGLIDFIEANLPGAKFDESKLVELQALDRRYYVALHDIYELRKHVPSADHPRDVFREPLSICEYANPARLVEYYESYRDELREKLKKGFVAVGEEKLRIVWGISGPYGANIWDYLAKRGVSVPYWHYGQARRIFKMPYYGDVAEFGRKLSPIEEEARLALYNSWAGDGERWVRDTVQACKDFQADGFVYFDQTGCQPVLGLGRLVEKRLEEEMGIPMWYIEGRMLLGRTERTEAEFMTGLEAFINLCFDSKKGR